MDGKITNTAFWLALLDMGQDIDQRARLWNGYLGWKLPPRIKGEYEPHSGRSQLIVDPPDGVWPELTEEEKEIIETLAEQHGGHPTFDYNNYMNFPGRTFCDGVDLAELTLVCANFDKAKFKSKVILGEKTRFYDQSSFREVIFERSLFCFKTRFEADVFLLDCVSKRRPIL